MMIQPQSEPSFKKSRKRTRACQAPHLAVLRQKGPAAALASVEADLDTTFVQIKDTCRLGRQLDKKLVEARYRFACLLDFLEEHGLVDNLARYIADRWPGEAYTLTSWRQWMGIRRTVTETVVFSGRATFSVMRDLSRLKDEDCREHIEDAILSGQYRSRQSRQAIKQASEALEAKCSPEEVIEAAERGLNGRRAPRRGGEPDLDVVISRAGPQVRTLKGTLTRLIREGRQDLAYAMIEELNRLMERGQNDRPKTKPVSGPAKEEDDQVQGHGRDHDHANANANGDANANANVNVDDDVDVDADADAPSTTKPSTSPTVASLCVDYRPPPYPYHLPDITIPSHWPPDYQARWLDVLRPADEIILCTPNDSPQYGTLGRTIRDGFAVGLDLQSCHGIWLFGTPSSGKTYAADVITHMALQHMRNVNVLDHPLGAVALHYHHEEGYEPEILSLVSPNREPAEILHLVEDLHAQPVGVNKVTVVCSARRVELMRQRHPHARVFPLVFDTAELGAQEIMGLLGLNQPNDNRLYTRQVRQALREHLKELTLPGLERALAKGGLRGEAKELVKARLGLMRPNVCDGYPLSRLPGPEELIVLDLRDSMWTEEEAMTMGSMGMQVMTRGGAERGYNMVIRVDEAHKFLKHPVMAVPMHRMQKERRHMGLITLYSTQDPLGVPVEMLSSADLLLVGRMPSPEALRHLCKGNQALRGLPPGVAAALQPGQMVACAETRFVDAAAQGKVGGTLLVLRIRSQTGQHGGKTVLAGAKDK